MRRMGKGKSTLTCTEMVGRVGTTQKPWCVTQSVAQPEHDWVANLVENAVRNSAINSSTISWPNFVGLNPSALYFCAFAHRGYISFIREVS